MKNKTLFYNVVLLFLSAFQLSAQTVISNVKENVVNVQDGSSSVNSGVIINNGSAEKTNLLRGNGNIASEKRELPPFESVSVTGSFDLEVTLSNGAKPEALIKADSNLLENIKTSVEDGQLKISSVGSYSPTRKIIIILTAPSLKALLCEGSNNISAGLFASEAFTLKNLGGCNLIGLSGKVKELQVQLGGASKLDSQALSADTAVLNLSGAAECMVNVKNSIKAKASGASKIFYNGTPEITKELSGAAKLLPRGPKN